MSTPTIDYAGLAAQNGAINSIPASEMTSAGGKKDYSALAARLGDLNQPPTQPGTITNDVGNTVIVPKEGESFADTMQRAASQGRRTTPEQINKEVATIPEKGAEALGVAAVAALPLAGAGAIDLAANAIPKVLPATIEGVKAWGAWASTHPVQAYILFQMAKELLPGVKKAAGIVKGIPDGQ